MDAALRQTLRSGKFVDVDPVHARRMRAVRSKDNRSTERCLRLALVRAGVSGWKFHPPSIVGNPDFLFSEERLAVFVDGCFWHGCSICGHLPRKNSAYWAMKIQRNQMRDRKTTRRLRGAGFTVYRIWEHEIQHDRQAVLSKIEKRLSGCR